MIYLDNNATTALDPRVLAVIQEELKATPANPSSIHSFGREARNRLIEARQTIANTLKVDPHELTFTSGATESLNTLLYGLTGHLITSDIEHPALYQTAKRLQTPVTFLSTGLSGAVTLQQIQEAIRPDTQLIALSAVNSETGVKNPLPQIAKLAHKHHIPFIVDAVALLGKEPVHFFEGITAMVFSGHKIHGPTGIGLTWIRKDYKTTPLFTGGSQEFSRRPGTENLPAIRGLAKAIELLPQELPAATHRMERLRDHFETSLRAAIPDLIINGTGPRIVNTSNLTFVGMDGETLLMQLDLNGIAASLGSACSAGALEPSRILRNMGISLSHARSALRFSLSRFTTEEEIETAIQEICCLAKR